MKNNGIELTRKNFRVIAIKAYDNPYCLNEDEFNNDLKRLVTIRKMIANEHNGNTANIKLIINHLISYYNVFEHDVATDLLMFKLDDYQKPYACSLLKFLNLPLPFDHIFNNYFYKKINNEYKN